MVRLTAAAGDAAARAEEAVVGGRGCVRAIGRDADGRPWIEARRATCRAVWLAADDDAETIDRLTADHPSAERAGPVRSA